MTVYLKNASDFAAMDEIYRSYFSKDPPARTTVMVDLLNDALVEVSMTAIAGGGPREVILPAGWMKPTSPYSYAILSPLEAARVRNLERGATVERQEPIQGEVVAPVVGVDKEEIVARRQRPAEP